MNCRRTSQVSLGVQALTVLLILLVAGCSQSPESLRQSALEASREATSAAEEQDAKRAIAASRRATKLLRKLEKQAETNEAAKRLVGEVRLAVMAAQKQAELVDEQRQHRECLTGLKVKAYRATRGVALQGLLSAAALGADQMAVHGTNVLKDNFELQLVAMRLTELAQEFPEGDLSGMTNWTNVAATLRIWATNPPPETGVVLALAFAGTGQADLAVTELDMIGTNVMASPNTAMLVHGTRAMVYVTQGWNQLAAAEVEQLAVLAPESDYDIKSEDAVILLRVLMVGDAVHQQDWQKLDELVAECIKIAPNHPMVAYLTGEQLAANGDWEKAAESMEAQARSAEEKWVAEKLSQRARELRDGRGNQNRFVDSKLFLDMSVFLLQRHAKDTEAARKLAALWEHAGVAGKGWFDGSLDP
jgi:hypothetical protein